MRNIQIFNSMTRKKEEFIPLTKGEVSMYVCGVTPYDSAHIGNAVPAIVFDTMFRFLKADGRKVKYIRNFTDVDDKIIAKANAEGVTCEEISKRYIDIYHSDMKHINVLGEADTKGEESFMVEPLVTDNMDGIIDIIVKLLEKDIAYIAPSGDVLYDVTKFEDYGKLSGKILDQLEAGARVEVSADKKGANDFVLWKSAKAGEPSWDFSENYSTVNAGRPGWHIECSAMSKKHLGTSFDIHGGGEDLQFPHHECEIAQSKGACGGEYARYWMHNAFITVDGEKMSKSLGNFTTITQLLEKFSGEAIRLWMLSTHYRKPTDLSEKALNDAAKRLAGYYQAAAEALSAGVKPLETPFDSLMDAMANDLNTAAAIAEMDAVKKELNTLVSGGLKMISKKKKAGRALYKLMYAGNDIMGFMCQDPTEAVKGNRDSVDSDAIEALIESRKQAKADKDWAAADSIRAELTALNIVIKDRPDGTTEWTVSE
jgi:cysteinyl-tRNA synthetase